MLRTNSHEEPFFLIIEVGTPHCILRSRPEIGLLKNTPALLQAGRSGLKGSRRRAARFADGAESVISPQKNPTEKTESDFFVAIFFVQPLDFGPAVAVKKAIQRG